MYYAATRDVFRTRWSQLNVHFELDRKFNSLITHIIVMKIHYAIKQTSTNGICDENLLTEWKKNSREIMIYLKNIHWITNWWTIHIRRVHDDNIKIPPHATLFSFKNVSKLYADNHNNLQFMLRAERAEVRMVRPAPYYVWIEECQLNH